MKFTEFPYVRPDLTAAMAKLDELAKTIREAQDAAAAKDAFLAYEEIAKEVGSAHAISSVRHTVNTKDAFYNEENAFWDENSPILNDKYLDIYRAMVSSPLTLSWKKRWASCCSPKWRSMSNPPILPSFR